MLLTKFTHACVRLRRGDTTLVIDPGAFVERDALDGADAVLITHEHFDHLDADAVRAVARANPRLTVWTNGSVAKLLGDLEDQVRAVNEGDGFDVGGLGVEVYGTTHAPNHPDDPPPANVGFLVAGELFYPGDALTVPPRQVNTLLVPTNAPWMRLRDLVDYVRAVAPRRAYSTHDGLLNDVGLQLVDTWLARLGEEIGGDYRRIPPRETVELPLD